MAAARRSQARARADRVQAFQRRMRAALAESAIPADAPAMQAYMKSAMPFLGVHKDALRRIVKQLSVEAPFDDSAGWSEVVLHLFRGATHREERTAAVELALAKASRPFQSLEALPTYEAMIVEGAWWDLVDPLAAHGVGGLLATHGAHVEQVKRAMRAWARDADLWKRRCAILSQLQHKAKTDRALLYACIEPSLASKEFFLRKAIGWALRQYARVEPDEVERYVRAHASELSGLSKREALKALLKSGAVGALP
jgi:3-methyladenine DNA glycosylase AlkD